MNLPVSQVPFFSIVIPTLNEEIALPQLLQDLDYQTFKNFSVIVVDAHSHDATPTLVKSHQQHASYPLKLINSKIRNVSSQRNNGAMDSSSPYLLFIDADSRIEPKCLEIIHHELSRDSSIDLFTTWVKPATDSIDEAFCATFTNISFEISKAVGLPWCFGAFIGIKRSVFLALNGFDPLLTYGEDVRLIHLAVKQGFRFEVINKTKYVFSFRRHRHHGYLKTISKIIELDFEQNVAKRKVKSTQYPMGGHLYADKPTKTAQITKRYTSSNRSIT